MKILFVSSAGGHFTELLQLNRILNSLNSIIVATKRRDTKNIANYLLKHKKGISKYISHFFRSVVILIKENPDIIISTGAGDALPMIILAKLFRKKVIFIESFSRPFNLSRTGKIVYKYNLANLFLVQWPELVKKYPKAKYWGRMI